MPHWSVILAMYMLASDFGIDESLIWSFKAIPFKFTVGSLSAQTRMTGTMVGGHF